jgi:hypothetical protein
MKRTDAVANQLKAEIELRKAVVALAKFLKPPKPKPPKPGSHPGNSNTPKPPSFEYNPDSKEGQRMLSASPPGGPEVAKDKSKWQSLGPRERAAVDEKYARELPVEYRQLLEDYFEALSKKGDNSSAGATTAPATPKKP